MNSVDAALDELKALQRELAVVQDTLAGPRMRWRRVRDNIAAEILVLDPVAQEVTDWRPMTPETVAMLDAERARFLADVGDLPAAEKTLKAAIRTAEIDLKAAQKAAKEDPANSPKTPRNTAPTDQLRMF